MVTVVPTPSARPQIELAAHVLHHVLDDGETETEAALARGPRPIDAIEALRHGAELPRRDALTAVRDPDGDRFIPDLGPDLDPAAAPVVLDGVVDEIAQNPVEPAPVAPHDHVLGNLLAKLDAGRGRLGTEITQDIADQRAAV